MGEFDDGFTQEAPAIEPAAAPATEIPDLTLDERVAIALEDLAAAAEAQAAAFEKLAAAGERVAAAIFRVAVTFGESHQPEPRR